MENIGEIFMTQESNTIQCPRCGSERVVYYIMIKGPFAILKVACPNDQIRQVIRLPLDARDQWMGQVADQIFRCTICGAHVPNPAKIVRSGRWMVLFIECPSHGLKDPKRYILDTVYPMIQNLHQNMGYGGAAPPTFTPPPATDMFNRVSSPKSPPPPPPPGFGPPPPPSQLQGTSKPSSDAGKVKFCNECGSTIQAGAIFCVNCGKEIEEDQ